MNSNLCVSARSGVSYTENCGTCLLGLLVFSIILSFGTSLPVDRYNYSGITPSSGPKDDKMFLRTKSNKILVIKPDGSIEGSSCVNKYALLKSGSHMNGQTKQTMTTIYGIGAQKFLCVSPNGTVYSVGMKHFNEDDCGFEEKFQYRNSGTKDEPEVYYYTKYRHHKHGPRTTERIRKYHIALGCNNKAIAISKKWEREYYENDTLFMVENTSKELSHLNKTCKDTSRVLQKSKCKKARRKKCSELVKPRNGETRTYVKFCRNVVENFFSATLRDFRLFHKRNCWDVLRRYRRCKKQRRERRQRDQRQRKSLRRKLTSSRTS